METSQNKFNGLEITEIQINMISSRETQGLQAIARIVLNGLFVINSIDIKEGKFGTFISFPRVFNKEEQKGYSICYPISKEFHEYMSERILKEYKLFV